MNWPRFISAFLVAPLTPALIFVVASLLFGAPLQGMWGMFILVSLVAYSHEIVLGVPTAWLLGRSRPLTLLRVLSAAFVIGIVPFGGVILYQELTMPAGAEYEANGVVHREDGHLPPPD